MARAHISKALREKLSLGWTVEEAAEQLGIPIQQAKEAAEATLKKSSLDDAGLHLLAFDALRCGLEKLKEIVRDGPREYVTGKEGTGIDSVDLIAAKALVDSALKIRSLIGRTKEKAAELEGDKGATKSPQPDLWDLYGPWRLKNPEDG